MKQTKNIKNSENSKTPQFNNDAKSIVEKYYYLKNLKTDDRTKMWIEINWEKQLSHLSTNFCKLGKIIKGLHTDYLAKAPLIIWGKNIVFCDFLLQEYKTIVEIEKTPIDPTEIAKNKERIKGLKNKGYDVLIVKKKELNKPLALTIRIWEHLKSK